MLLHPTALSYISWDPSREAFTVPLIELSVMWYGIMFALGFILGYIILVPVATQFFEERNPGDPLKARAMGLSFTDRLVWFVVLGTLIGARLGHVLFYEFPFYMSHPMEIFMIRKGGLASHGGTIGVLVGVYLFLRFNRKNFPGLNFIWLMDLICIPTGVTAACIRIGNFINQEIVGLATTAPWGVIFEHPAEGVEAVPRHPVQLYEAGLYLLTFAVLFSMWKKYGTTLKQGTISGIFFIVVFGSRFFTEAIKLPQSTQMAEGDFQMGQYLSVPFVILGGALLLWPRQPQKP